MNKYKDLAELLIDLEQALINANLWQKEPVNPKDLQSSQPFCHDTLSANQWLQFVFIARLEQIIKDNLTLPANCNITPYIAESLKEHNKVEEITAITKQIDIVVSV